MQLLRHSMKRASTLAVAIALAYLCVIGCGSSDEQAAPDRSATEILPTGDFLSDSLGVGLALPNSPGWSFRHDPPIRGGPYVTAVHESETASVRLFVTPATDNLVIDDIIRRRRDHLAGLFGVSDLDQVIDRVIIDERQEVDGYPASQWQAITEPVDIAGETASRVVFMWIATLRGNAAYECVGLARFPVDLTPEQRAASEGLVNDMAFILQSLQIR